jgi:hypothetical protein
MRRQHGIWGKYPKLTAFAGCAALAGGLLAAATGLASASAGQRPSVQRVHHRTVLAAAGCNLGHGVKHVVQLTFDNVHFFRDNPNVPSDIEMMPNLLHFFEDNGTWMSNNHTPLIAHTANDILTTQTGLYADRHGMWGGQQQLPDLQPRRHLRPGERLRILDRPGLRHRLHPDRRP